MNQKIAIYGLILLGSGCSDSLFKGTSTGNAMEMGIESSEGEATMRSSSGVTFTITSANADVDRIAFPLPSLVKCDKLGLSDPISCDSTGKGAEITEDRTVDLFSATFDPPLDDFGHI